MTTRRRIQRDAARLWQLASVDGVPDSARVRRIVDQLIASGRRSRIAVLTNFLRLLRRDRDERTADVDSAVPLDAGARAAVEAGLARRYGRALTARFTVDPSLIAGLRLTVGADRYDGSLRSRLFALEMPR